MSPSIEVRHLLAIDHIKSEKRLGKSVDELKTQFGAGYDQALHQALLGNASLEYIESECRFIFKFKGKLKSLAELEAKLGEGPVTVGEDMDASYEELGQDIEEMRLTQRILVIPLEKSKQKQKVLYKNPFSDIVIEDTLIIDPELREWFDTIKSAPSHSDMMLVLNRVNIVPTHLDCDNPPQIVATRRKKRVSTVAKAAKSKGLANMAAEMRAFISAGIDVSNLVINPKDDEELHTEDMDKAKNPYLYFDKDANPEQFLLVRRTIFILSKLFYSDLTSLILATFLEQKIYKEPDLVNLLALSREQVNRALIKLESHQLLNRGLAEMKGKRDDGSASVKKTTVWLIDLNRLFDYVNYRLIMLSSSLKQIVKTLKNQALQCPKCHLIYEHLEIGSLEQATEFSYRCKDCRTTLENVNNVAEQREKERLFKRSQEVFFPLQVELAKIGKRALPVRQNGNVQLEKSASNTTTSANVNNKALSSANSHAGIAGSDTNSAAASHFRSTGNRSNSMRAANKKSWSSSLINAHLNHTNSCASNSSSISSITDRATTNTNENRAEQEQMAKNQQWLEMAENSSFNASPIIWCSRGRILLPIIEDLDDWSKEQASQLAKDLLNNIAEFQKMVNHNYLYKITKNTLYIAYKQQIRPSEIIHLLSLLSNKPVPYYLFNLIMDTSQYADLYQATVVLRNSKYVVQSESEPVIRQLLTLHRITEIIPNPGTYSKVETPNGQNLFYFEIGDRPYSLETVKREAYFNGIPITDQYDFLGDVLSSKESTIQVALKPIVKIRDYQIISCSKMFWNLFKVHSGVLVLPCGAGKTLIGITTFAILEKPCIIFCQSSLAVSQWRDTFLKWTVIKVLGPESQVSRSSNNRGGNHQTLVSRFTASCRDEWNPKAPVIITTYAMFSNTSNRQEAARRTMDIIVKRQWGLMILDEVHQAPATVFREVTNGFKCHVKLGLTATLVREDEKVQELPYLVGPKHYELDIFTLKMRGHLAPVKCFEIQCPFTDYFNRIYQTALTHPHGKEQRKLLFVTNMNKTRICVSLIKQHLMEQRKIMIFCDDLFGLEWYHELLQRDKIDGSTPESERESILKRFRSTEGGDCVLFSKVGDMSIDLPEAEVIIQIAVVVGSRMQEGQRIGRVQRPQLRKKCAYFYSLITKNTEEERYAENRRKYLVEHGYTVHIENDISGYLSNDTERFYQFEEKLVDAVRIELNKRDIINSKNKRTANLDLSRSNDPCPSTRDTIAANRSQQNHSSSTSMNQYPQIGAKINSTNATQRSTLLEYLKQRKTKDLNDPLLIGEHAPLISVPKRLKK